MAVQPYLAGLDNFGAGIAVSANGSIIVPANQGANNCIIRQSLDQGASWSTVFTDAGATDNCGIRFATPTTNITRCDPVSGYCAVLNPAGGGAFDLVTYASTDNGNTWNRTVGTSVVSADQQFQLKISGTDGIAGLALLSAGNGFPVRAGNPFIESAVLNNNSARCWGANILSGTQVVCGPSSTDTTHWSIWNISSGVSAQLFTFTLEDSQTFAGAPDFHVSEYGTIGYLFSRNTANNKVNLYLSLTNFTGASLIGQLTPTTALIAGACRGESHSWGTKVYFTCGGVGSQAFFGVVQ
ncbi:MAG: hypothetical protein ACRDL7_01690 [Gaiellaceae bacterium]